MVSRNWNTFPRLSPVVPVSLHPTKTISGLTISVGACESKHNNSPQYTKNNQFSSYNLRRVCEHARTHMRNWQALRLDQRRCFWLRIRWSQDSHGRKSHSSNALFTISELWSLQLRVGCIRNRTQNVAHTSSFSIRNLGRRRHNSQLHYAILEDYRLKLGCTNDR